MLRRERRRRRLSMTSLIDVIFLLLLFFMLSSTFTRFAEVDLSAGAAGGTAPPSERPPVFLRLGVATLDLNGRAVSLDALADRLAPLLGDAPGSVLVSLRGAVDAQRLTDLLVALRTVPKAEVTVLEQNG
ncbi:ExbD/TolR family protein [Primorskyibacter sp. 2E107]|uniref:ExbD/TolR family protein n=1 Tax=Primorskyibacter sp. 2E107 TaxID=3403458 RepID=UPI003AF49D69